MRALLLLAGRSRRFWPLREKALFPLCGRTLLEHLAVRLRQAGVSDITLVGGSHNLEDARRILPDAHCLQQENLDLGMRGALLSALPAMGNDPVLIVSSNDVIDPEGYRTVMEAAAHADGALLAKRMDRYFPGGYLSVEDGRVTGIIEKPGEDRCPSDLVTVVAHVHNRPADLLSALREISGEAEGGYERAVTSLLRTHVYRPAILQGSWFPVKYPWHLLPLLKHFLGGIPEPSVHPGASVHPTAVVEGNIVLMDGVRVLPHATIRGPCVIGPRTIIGNAALVRESSIGPDCVIGYGTEVKGSILGSDVWTHMGYVGDSIIGNDVALGGGTMTGNFRLDECEIPSMVGGERVSTGLTKFGAVIGDHCRLGIRTSLQPGVKIGMGTFISGGGIVERDIPDQQFAILRDGAWDIRENRAQPADASRRERYRKGMSLGDVWGNGRG